MGGGIGWDLFTTEITWNSVFLRILGCWGKLGVMGFIIISSYFMIDSKIFKLKKVILLILEAFFYCFCFACIGIIMNDISLKEIIKELSIPIHPSRYWFLSTYILFYFLVPFLNKFLKSISLDYIKKLLLVLTLYIPVYNFIWQNVYGGQISIFIYLYIVVYYLKKTPNNFFEKNSKFGFLLVSSFIVFSSLVFLYIGFNLNLDLFISFSTLIFSSMNLIVLTDALFMFYIFKNMRIKNSKIINSFAKTTLGVYIIHDNWLLRKGTNRILWHRILHVNKIFYTPLFFIHMLLSIVGIFIICSIVEIIRSKIIDEKILNKISFIDKMCIKFDNWYN